MIDGTRLIWPHLRGNKSRAYGIGESERWEHTQVRLNG